MNKKHLLKIGYRKLNEKKEDIDKSEFKEIKVETIKDLVETVHYLIDILYKSYFMDQLGNLVFNKIYEKYGNKI
jgi:hypothetical protein